MNDGYIAIQPNRHFEHVEVIYGVVKWSSHSTCRLLYHGVNTVDEFHSLMGSLMLNDIEDYRYPAKLEQKIHLELDKTYSNNGK